MRAEEITQLLRRRPFQPFRIHATTGQHYDIRHPEVVIVQRQCMEIGLDPDPKSGGRGSRRVLVALARGPHREPRCAGVA
jgi:hypothetical protein